MLNCEQLLEDLLNKGKRCNVWLEDGSLEVYVRSSSRFINGERTSSLEIGNVSATRKGTGRFTRFLEFAESRNPGVLFVENVLEERFRQYFVRRGYGEYADGAKEGPVKSYYLLAKKA